MATKECVLCSKVEDVETKGKNKGRLYFLCKKCQKKTPNTLEAALWNVEDTIGEMKETTKMLKETQGILKELIKKEKKMKRKKK